MVCLFISRFSAEQSCNALRNITIVISATIFTSLCNKSDINLATAVEFRSSSVTSFF